MRVPRLSGTSIFTRVLLVLLACIVAVQLVNFALFSLMGPPPPAVHAASQIADVLRRGGNPAGRFAIGVRNEADQSQGVLPTALAGALARQLGVEPDKVRLEMFGPSDVIDLPSPHRRRGGPPAPVLSDGVLMGDFTAALRRPDGRWTVVTPARSRAGAWRGRTVLWLLAALAAAVPFAWALAGRVAKPIGLFAAAADRIGRDPRTAPLPVEGPAEIANAATAFNEMQRRFHAYVEDRTMMIGAVAHDLRTPLMRLSLRLENAPERLREGCGRDVAEMQAMIRAATDYVRDVTRAGTRRRLDLRSLAETVVDDYADRGEPVTLAPGEALVAEGDAVALKAALDDLVGNALRYAGDAAVRVAREDGHAVVEVRDHGPGVPEDDLPRVFEPFFRGERSRNRDTGGIGLGLASVRGMARAHGGDATLANHPGGGVLARLVLPL